MSDGAQSAGAGGIMESARGLVRSLLGLAQTRIELFGVELQEEKLRAIRLMTWFAAAVAFGSAGVLVAVGAAGIFFWQAAGYWGLIGLAVVTLGVGAAILWWVHRQIMQGAAPFSATVAEFRKDSERLQSRS